MSSKKIMETAIMLSDVDFARWYVENVPVSRETKKYYREQMELYEFTESEESYLEHYHHWEGQFYNGSYNKHSEADWAANRRCVSIAGMLGRHVHSAARVLDFGCAYGHITRELAKKFSDMRFLGVDIVPEAVAMFNQLSDHHGLENCRAVDHLPLVRGKYDVVIAAEVLEHVVDPYETLGNLASCLKSSGTIITTLPCGPWEAQGYAKNPEGREHLRHWSLHEIREVFGDKTFLDFYEAGLSRERLVLGSYVTCSKVGDFGRVDMKRKLASYEQFVAMESPPANYWMVN